ncbi:MAG: cyclopropane-fatty-acyl-phospholipid synthase family protein [Thermoanaerobaculales bacterium]|nr:cyclopropane-fatty-acyl-phospholipid synthase family protein [Thermoanaerobaculales bacterium]
MAKITHQREQTETIDMGAFGVGTDTPSQLDRTRRRSLPLAARIVLGRLSRIGRGHLIVRLPDGSHHTFSGSDGGAAEVVRLEIHRWRFFSRLLRRADIGAGEAFVDGDWSSSNLVGLTRLFLDNESELAPPSVLGAIGRFRDRLTHLLRSNTRAQARRNIHAHYDLSNELYALFLDPSMTYSSALFDHPGLDLEAAQHRKYQRIAAWADLEPGHDVLEIGCGWGGFAEYAAGELECRVTSITLSEEQASFARRRMIDAGLEDRVQIRVMDYRDVDAKFDAVISIEMLEAVGHRFLDGFFATCDCVLRPGGRMALQTITIPDQVYDRYRRGTDWIRANIFPGGHLPSLGAIQGSLARRTGLVIDRLDNLANDYATTLKQWRERFWSQEVRVRALGFDDRFMRIWDFYLATCEAAFRDQQIGVLQLSLARSGRGGR